MSGNVIIDAVGVVRLDDGMTPEEEETLEAELDVPEEDAVEGTDLWDQLPGESDLWYSRFRYYLTLGPGRALHQVVAYYTGDGVSSNHALSLTKISARFNWRARAAAWDRNEHRKDDLFRQEARLESQRVRLALLNMVRTKFEAGVETLEPGDLTWPMVAPLLRTIVQEIRSEYEPQMGRGGVNITMQDNRQVNVHGTDAVGLLRTKIMQLRETMQPAEDNDFDAE